MTWQKKKGTGPFCVESVEQEVSGDGRHLARCSLNCEILMLGLSTQSCFRHEVL